MSEAPGFRRVWALATGVLPLMLGWWLYKLAITLWAQISVPRILGLFDLVFGVLAVLAAAVALASRLLPRIPPRAAYVATFGVVLLAFTLIGLSIFYLTPRFAPTPVLGGVAVWAAVLMGRFVRYDEATQRLVTRLLAGMGLAVQALVLLPLPWVVFSAITDQPRLDHAPSPPVGVPVLAGAPKRIILVTFDALRARSVSERANGNTPAMASLAADGTVYDDARAASDSTQVSMPTVLTGIRPSRYFPHVNNDSLLLRDGFMTGMAGHLAPAGYTAYYATMLIAPDYLGQDSEFADGVRLCQMFLFNRFNTREFLPLGETLGWTREKLSGRWDEGNGKHEPEIQAVREVFDHGLEDLQRGQGRTFLWMHLGAPHTPYFDVPAARALDPGDPGQYPKVTWDGVSSADPALLAHYQDVYEHYLHFADAQFGRFLGELKAKGLYDDSLIVLTGDHGEEFGLPGHNPHGNGIATEDVAHVPLIIHLPHQHAPSHVTGLVAHRDILPTVLAHVYQQVPEGLHGLVLPDHGAMPDRYVFTWAMSSKYVPKLKQAQTIAEFHGPYKYLVRYPTHEESLYDLARDPEAELNVANRFPGLMADMRTHLKAELYQKAEGQ